MQFIDQSLLKVLPDGGRSASDSDILSIGGSTSAFQRDVDPVRHEMKGRTTLHDERRTSMIGEHENLRMINRVLTPPSSPTLIRPGTSHGPKHISPHYPGPDIVKAASSKVVVNPADLSAFTTEHLLLKRASRERPSVKGRSANSQRVLQALIRTGTKAVNRNGVALYSEFRHGFISSVAVFGKERSRSHHLKLSKRPSPESVRILLFCHCHRFALAKRTVVVVVAINTQIRWPNLSGSNLRAGRVPSRHLLVERRERESTNRLKKVPVGFTLP